MKILLIDPPFKSFAGFFSFYFPLGLGYLAGCVKKRGFEAKILDMDVAEGKTGDLNFTNEYQRFKAYIDALNNPSHPTWDLLRTLVREQRPDVIGITALTTKFGTTIQTARFCKQILPDVPIIVGGAHASTMPDLTLDVAEVDYVVRGEADETLPLLLEALRDKRDVAGIKGVSWRKDGKVVHNPEATFVQDLDSVPFPDRKALVHPGAYSSEDMGVMLTSRGCLFGCSYCFHMWNRRVRFRSVPNIIEEIREVRRDFGTAQFSLKDDSFTVRKSHVLAFCEALMKEPFRIGWSCTTRVDIIDEELVIAMKKAGCNSIAVGIESGSKRILEETDKGITFPQILKAAKLLNKHSMFWSGYFMIGLPTETEEDIDKTLRFLERVNPFYAGLGVYNPFPRTKLFDQGVELGLLNPRPPLEHFLQTHPKDLFFIDPRRRVVAIGHERFEEIRTHAVTKFHQHNTRFFNLVRRGLARRRNYMHDPAILWRDIQKGLEFLGLRGGSPDAHP